MGYSTENYRAVKELIQSRRAAAIRQAEENRLLLHSRSDRIAEIDRTLQKTGLRLFGIACEGGPDLRKQVAQLKEENRDLLQQRAQELKRLGYPTDFTEPHYTCPVCGDTGFVDTHMCACMKRELVLAGCRSSGLGALMDRQTFENFSLSPYRDPHTGDGGLMERNFNTIRKYAETFVTGAENLLFIGKTGLGKTHLSTALARTVIERGYDVVYETTQNLLADFEHDRFRRTSRDTDEDRCARYFDCDLLIMDDLGTELSNQFTISVLYNLLNTRINRRMSMLINTNLSAAALRERYEDRIYSRLIGEFRPLLFEGSDMRNR